MPLMLATDPPVDSALTVSPVLFCKICATAVEYAKYVPVLPPVPILIALPPPQPVSSIAAHSTTDAAAIQNFFMIDEPLPKNI